MIFVVVEDIVPWCVWKLETAEKGASEISRLWYTRGRHLCSSPRQTILRVKKQEESREEQESYQ